MCAGAYKQPMTIGLSGTKSKPITLRGPDKGKRCLMEGALMRMACKAGLTPGAQPVNDLEPIDWEG
jgi:hypothetical protein